jgi:hypothetical protein
MAGTVVGSALATGAAEASLGFSFGAAGWSLGASFFTAGWSLGTSCFTAGGSDDWMSAGAADPQAMIKANANNTVMGISNWFFLILILSSLHNLLRGCLISPSPW